RPLSASRTCTTSHTAKTTPSSNRSHSRELPMFPSSRSVASAHCNPPRSTTSPPPSRPRTCKSRSPGFCTARPTCCSSRAHPRARISAKTSRQPLSIFLRKCSVSWTHSAPRCSGPLPTRKPGLLNHCVRHTVALGGVQPHPCAFEPRKEALRGIHLHQHAPRGKSRVRRFILEQKRRHAMLPRQQHDVASRIRQRDLCSVHIPVREMQVVIITIHDYIPRRVQRKLIQHQPLAHRLRMQVARCSGT